jgi:hypothetical protein
MNSVILQPVSLPETAKKKKRKAVAGKLQAALTALKTLAGSQGSQSSRLTTGQGGVPLGDWQAELRKVEPNKTNRPRLKRDLLARGYIRVENGFVYLN